ncbi:hypothetical protein CLU81_5188 [Flavobacterium sp. 9]|uniref:hypothetical protein n=1 Tax=Flavobacterium sp. 9 TaxID=2035198 RepID=UPI000C1892BB|nr:hypothetical protein [Flavobacterium sp. 9]PIF34533.1 hypothetical protein CLU81_5188 [Flavobacterium sp. 9]
MEKLNYLITSISSKELRPTINLDRPTYIQPEDRIQYRSIRLIIILGMLNTKFGLSKNVIACVDFLLRNDSFQLKFISEYFSGQKNVISKLMKLELSSQTEIDFNVVQYKSVPWDLRFNDMLLFLYVRDLILYKSDKDNNNIRILLSDKGIEVFGKLKEIFPSEVNFLELFGSRMIEEKTLKIITDVIPNSYWKQNAETKNK